ncbi:TRAP transporter fused permease subunit [Natrialba sp. INN-245]|uniref:TRAP transporter permease n=1 Tax=Natrialba sp. INN-245 TaxID=2690967 RepID=UPI0013116F94|nr:TRAP transporter fused permease subunit [Natrialba sp. INN-245]MWV38442.1 TRAP transporter fused permease subunit [Natrialba sp. INN-245]
MDTALNSADEQRVGGEATILQRIIAVGVTLFTLYVALTLQFNSYQQLGTFLLLTLVYLFVKFPLREEISYDVLPSDSYYDWIDRALIALSVVSYGYLIVFSQQVIEQAGTATPTEIVLGIFAIIVVVEATRRTIGWAIPILAVFSLLYLFIGPLFPGVFRHSGYSLEQMATQIYVSSQGLFSFPLSVMFDYVFVFVLFGALLEISGGGKMFLDLAKVLFGKVTGGPAKLTVFASGSMGMISGSAVANALTTGAFTIPTMKDQGYERNFAAGVESAASAGGQLLPPVMGAAIFIMMDITAIDYVTIIERALVPGLLTFFCVYMVVHFQSVKMNLVGLPDEMIPDRRSVISRLYYFVPLVILVYLLYTGMSVRRSIVYSLAILLFITFIPKDARLYDPRSESDTLMSNSLVDGIELACKRAAPIIVAATCIGIVLGVIGLTGLGLAISSVVMDLAGTHLMMALLVTMVLCIIFGMATDTVTVYILLAILVAPSLVRIGLPELTAHLFIFYFGMMAMVTPPVCIAAYAASTIAESHPLKTGFWAWKLSLGAFLLPFAFVYDERLLLIGSADGIAIAILTTSIGFVALAAAIVGHIYTGISRIERGMLVGSALLLIHPSLTLNAVGLLVGLVGGYRQIRSRLKDEHLRSTPAKSD